jgi:hypothetical protein
MKGIETFAKVAYRTTRSEKGWGVQPPWELAWGRRARHSHVNQFY